jgi:hypothetical protein
LELMARAFAAGVLFRVDEDDEDGTDEEDDEDSLYGRNARRAEIRPLFELCASPSDCDEAWTLRTESMMKDLANVNRE